MTNKKKKLAFTVYPSLPTSFPLLFSVINGERKKRGEEENGGKGMGTTETGNYSGSLVF